MLPTKMKLLTIPPEVHDFIAQNAVLAISISGGKDSQALLHAVTRENEPITDQQKIDWFRSVNFLGTPQDKEHLNDLLK
jgi:hypothetical protein